MREIKFRGQRVADNEWVYGGISIFQNEATIFDCECVVNSAYDVAIETVGQFTGLKDKNGVDIYEGDILSYEDGSEVIEIIYNGNAFEGKRLYRDILFHNKNIENKNYLQFKVIGNIHSNPELIH